MAEDKVLQDDAVLEDDDREELSDEAKDALWAEVVTSE